MIVARIEGGLGNQMFQYAFGLQLASQNQTELILDLASYGSRPDHGYLLNQFSIDAREMLPSERKRIPGKYRTGKRSLIPLLRLTSNRLQRLRERPFGFGENYMSAGDNRYLVGYWQSEKFFRDVVPRIREQFQPRSPLSTPSARIHERMLSRSSIAIHVRRGDYITSKPMATRNLSLEYYQLCVEMQLEKRPQSEVYLFSNDMQWCREHLKLPCPVHFIDYNNNATAHEDLWLMTAAESCIIANSTFSWWGAYLSRRSNNTVYAPSSWYRPNTLDDQHINCGQWVTVSDPVEQRQAA